MAHSTDISFDAQDRFPRTNTADELYLDQIEHYEPLPELTEAELLEVEITRRDLLARNPGLVWPMPVTTAVAKIVGAA